MASKISWLLLMVSGIFVESTTAAPPANCTLIISELQLPLFPTVKSEFIELQASPECFQSGPLFLNNYTLILWHGGNKQGVAARLLNRGQFASSENVNCTQMNNTLLLIGNPDMDIANGTQFCSFEEFGMDWSKPNNNNSGYIDKGKKRTNALVLYANLNSSNINLNDILDETNAHQDKIADVIFFAMNGEHQGDMLKLLYPDYHIGPAPENIYFRLDDKNDKQGKADKHSFSFCCPLVPGKWPVGFRWSPPTPGTPNNCSATISPYFFDPNGTTYHLEGPKIIDRCNVSAMTNYNPHKPTPAPPSSTTSKPAPASTIGRTVGIALGVCLAGTIACVLALYAIGRIRRRRYAHPGQGAPNERCFSLRCLQRNEDADRLVMDD